LAASGRLRPCPSRSSSRRLPRPGAGPDVPSPRNGGSAGAGKQPAAVLSGRRVVAGRGHPSVPAVRARDTPSVSAIDGSCGSSQMGPGLLEVRQRWETLWVLTVLYFALAGPPSPTRCRTDSAMRRLLSARMLGVVVVIVAIVALGIWYQRFRRARICCGCRRRGPRDGDPHRTGSRGRLGPCCPAGQYPGRRTARAARQLNYGRPSPRRPRSTRRPDRDV
jgi:hypothetical protein